jgi:hypothetical protein
LKPSQLTKRIEELSEKLKPVPSEGIRIDFNSFTEPEQLVILKNLELNEKYQGRWTHEVIMENKELILKLNHIAISRVMELFSFAMPRAMMLDEVEQWFFKFHFNEFFRRWFECQENVSKWSEKDREDFLRDIKIEPKAEKKRKSEVKLDGEENNN